jgi:uncharacterized protein (TIGR02300 family)
VANPALGTKRICSGCAAKFYDLGKDPIVCPTCDTVFVIPKPEPPRGGRRSVPRTSYDPKLQSADPMGTLKEADAPGVAADDKEAAGDDAGEVETVEAEEGEAEEPGGVPMLEEFDEK